jgi:prepilin-type N-terminal cleavage/methylation domain-containing protein
MYPGTLTVWSGVPNISIFSRTLQVCPWVATRSVIGNDLHKIKRGSPFWRKVAEIMRTNKSHNTGWQSGFSLLEMMMVLAIMMIASSITFMSLQPVLKQQRVTNGYNTTLGALRLARDNAVAQRTSYSVTFNNAVSPNTVTVAPTFVGFQGVQRATTFTLPTNVTFDAEPGIPTGNLNAPDRFGTGANAIDFGYTGQGAGVGAQTIIYFCPDGSAQDGGGGGAGQCSGNSDSGVVYIARTGDVMSSRALTVWGATGRIRGWRVYGNGGGGKVWKRQ